MPHKHSHTEELKEQVDHALKHLGHEDPKSFPSWTRPLSLTTALIAALTAIGSLGTSVLSHRAIMFKSDMVYTQAKASDQWAYYQAKGIKRLISEGFADGFKGKQADLAAHYREQAAKYKKEQEDLQKEANDVEGKIHGYGEQADRALDYHHHFDIAVTLFQVAIALSAIAVLARRRILWHLGLALSGIGLIFFMKGVLYFL